MIVYLVSLLEFDVSVFACCLLAITHPEYFGLS